MSDFAAQVTVQPAKTIVTVDAPNAITVQPSPFIIEVTTIGAQGATGAGGGSEATSIGGAPVAASGASEGDVLRFDGNAWRNYPETGIVDGGNF